MSTRLLRSKMEAVSACFVNLLGKLGVSTTPASQEETVYAIISVARQLDIMTGALDTKITEATCYWSKLISSSNNVDILFSAILKAKDIAMDTQPFIQQWKDGLLNHGNDSELFSALSMRKSAGTGIDENIFRERWVRLIVNSHDKEKVYNAILQASVIGAEDQLLKDTWKNLELHSSPSLFDNNIQSTFTAIEMAASIGVETQPFKDKLISLLLDERISRCELLFAWIPQCASIGLDCQVLEEQLKIWFFGRIDVERWARLMPKLLEFCAVPTGKIILVQVFREEPCLAVSFQLLSGNAALAQASLSLDTTVATLQDYVKQRIGWHYVASIDSLTNSPLQKNEALREYSDIIIQERGLSADDLKTLGTRLILSDMKNHTARNLLQFLVHRAKLKASGIDVVGHTPLREWVASAISRLDDAADIRLFKLDELVTDVPNWSSAMCDRLKVLEGRTEAHRCLSLRPSVGTWLTPHSKPLKNKRLCGSEYKIVVDKSLGRKLGIDVDNQDGMSLVVEGIGDGLIQDWNERNPNCAVHIDDCIVEVNGIRDDLVSLVNECKKNTLLFISLIAG